MKRWLWSILVLVILFSSTLPLQIAAEEPKRGGTLTLAIKRRLLQSCDGQACESAVSPVDLTVQDREVRRAS